MSEIWDNKGHCVLCGQRMIWAFQLTSSCPFWRNSTSISMTRHGSSPVSICSNSEDGSHSLIMCHRSYGSTSELWLTLTQVKLWEHTCSNRIAWILHIVWVIFSSTSILKIQLNYIFFHPMFQLYIIWKCSQGVLTFKSVMLYCDLTF